MHIAQCPHCREAVRVPACVGEETEVQCPWCHESFAGVQILEQLPPALVVLSGAVETGDRVVEPAGEASAGTAFAHLERLSSESEHGADLEAESDSDRFRIQHEQAEGTSASAALAARAARRPARNPVWEFSKVAGGALLAIPIAQLILWWLPGKWQRDPLQLGPTVGAYAPWIVPANLRAAPPEGEPERSRSDRTPVPSTARTQRSSSPPQGEKAEPRRGERQAGDGTPASRPPAEKLPVDGGGGFGPPADAPGGIFGLDQLSRPGRLPDQPPGTGRPTESTETGTPPPVSGTAAGDGLTMGVRNAPSFTADEFLSALDEVKSQGDVLDAAFGDQLNEQVRQELDQQYFTSLNHLAHVVTYVNPDSGDLRGLVDRLKRTLDDIAARPKKLALIGNYAAARLDRKPQQGGLVLYGTVKRITPHGPLYETQIELAARDKKSVTVMSQLDPRGIYRERSRVLMVGALVDQPSLNLSGYFGEAPFVVLGSFPLVVSQ